MQIACTTTQAAARVLVVLIDAGLQLGYECRLTRPRGAGSPITFVITKDLPADVMCQVQRIANTTIVNDRA